MGLDDALMARARVTGEAVFRVYAWSTPTLSLGRNQTALGVYSGARAADLGVDIVRRRTGGRAVLHHREVTYSVTAPAPDASTPSVSYHQINALLLRALSRLGVEARIAVPKERMPKPSSAPCFELPAAGEIEFDGRKLAGSAQLRENGALLQHGSILIDDDQGLVGRLASSDVGEAPRAATLRDALGRVPSLAEASDAVFSCVRELVDPDATVLALEGALHDEAARSATRFVDEAWTWRR